MDATVGLAIIVGLVVLATTVGLVVPATMAEVLAAMVGLVVLAIIADQLAFPGLDAVKTRERNRRLRGRLNGNETVTKLQFRM